MDLCASSLVFSMITWFACRWSSTLFCSDVGIIILPPFLVVSSVIPFSYANDQYGFTSFCTSAFVDGQSHNTYSDHIPECSSSRVASHISSAITQSDISVHVCLPWGCVLIASLLWTVVVQLCRGPLCWINLYEVVVFVFCVASLIYLFLKIVTRGFWSVIMLTC